ncbi:hypothetical protein CERZMDRAFT_103579 [Cercospora zeae-maydis SCOH1-5]|uniref:Uncharacterized protein n=1 Tax=Cercospora zeae-maydis SCOH1-5 TaxID=717836 RepID=A0A6A6EX05_9PEZI|nr:hypothetical protein CERZMDRAFT_103579 [Cercospora zeae-maydis SCOH1-5]
MSPNGKAFILNPPYQKAPRIFLRPVHGAGVEEGKVSDVRIQTKTILKPIDEITSGASNGRGGVANLIYPVVYLTEVESGCKGMNVEWNKVFGSREMAPARATIGVKDLRDISNAGIRRDPPISCDVLSAFMTEL